MSDAAERDAAERKAARRHWPVRLYRLGDEPGDDLSATTTAVERLTMVTALTAETWALAGHPLPAYTRAETPMVLRKLAECSPNR